ncbi:MAG: adenosylcobinamide amidohydrolase [Theionarchaea archaeon]|nr:adenosylcobinamide amidohydrolase [Theionarchaea archaeon]MBU7041106.1 adenosylcobinamide amidohydrolase [Theionarchaea archaeon]
MEGVKVYVKDDCIFVESERDLTSLSSATFGGYATTTTILNLQVPREYDGNPESDLKAFAQLHGLSRFIGMMTAVDVNTYRTREEGDVLCIVTAGYANTVNTILIIDGDITLQGMVNAVLVACEAKAAAFHDLDVRESIYEGLWGTVTDSVVVACTGKGKEVKYCGRATELGRTIFDSVKPCVLEALMSFEKIQPGREIMKRLAERSISVEDLVDAEMEMFLENDTLSREDFRRSFEDELISILKDINVSSLILGALRLEEDGRKGLIPSLSGEEFEKDPIHLVADEILGNALANYIGGTLAVYEFLRVERVKPGIIGRAGPFLDDILGGLLAGISSKIFHEAGT